MSESVKRSLVGGEEEVWSLSKCEFVDDVANREEGVVLVLGH